MPRFVQPLPLLLANLTDRKLAAAVQYLKVENEILRARLPKRIAITPREKHRLVRLGRSVGGRIKEFVSLVTPRTFPRWMNGDLPRTGTARPCRPRGGSSVRHFMDME
jgi:putative transposase